MADEKKITLEGILNDETSFPLTLDELKIYMTDITHDCENLLFVIDFIQSLELISFYAKLLVSDTTDISSIIQSEIAIACIHPPKNRIKLYESIIYKSAETQTAEIKSRLYTHKITTAADIMPLDAAIFESFVRKEMKVLIEKFLSSDSPLELNVPESAKSEAMKILDTTVHNIHPADAFYLVWKDVYKNIDTNAVPRFIKYASSSNIGSSEAVYRLKWSVFFWSSFFLTNGLLIGYAKDSAYRLITIPLCWLGFSTFWQWRQRFCIVLGRSAVARYQYDGEEYKVLEACVLKTHAQRQRETYIRIWVSFFIVMALLMALPPWIYR